MVKEPGQHTSGGGSRETMAETASGLAEQARSAATQRIDEQKHVASQSLHAFAQAVRRASDELGKQDQTAAAQVVQQAAGGLEDLSRTLANQSLGEIVSTVRDYGRRNPMVLAGGAALLGMALGRVARSASAGSNGSDRSHELPSATTRSGTAGDFPASRGSAGAGPVTAPRPQTGQTPIGQRQTGGKSSGGSNE